MDNLKNQLQQTLVQLQTGLDQIQKIQEQTQDSVNNLQEQYDELAQQLSDELEQKQWQNGNFKEESIIKRLNKLQKKKKKIASQLEILESILKKDQDTNSSEESDHQISNLKRKIQHFTLDDDIGSQQIEGLVQNLNNLSLTKKKVKFEEEQQITEKETSNNTRSRQKQQKKIINFQSELFDDDSNYQINNPLEETFIKYNIQNRLKLREQLIQQKEYYQYKEQYLNEQLESNQYDNDVVLIDCDSQTYKQMNSITDQLREAYLQQQNESDQIDKLKKDMELVQKTLKNLG